MIKKYLVSIFLVSNFSVMALKVKDQEVILDKIEDYDLCQTRDYTGGWCQDALNRWVLAHPADVLKAARMTRRTMNSWGAVEFYSKAFEKGLVKCDDKDLSLAVMSALALPKASHESVVKMSKTIAIENCFEQYQKDLVKEASLGSYFFENVCHELVEKKAISGLKAKKCK